jgi:hypothetical protein
MAHQVVKHNEQTRHTEVFVESEADIANLPQTPTSYYALGSNAYDKDMNIWTLMSSGWEALD